MAQSAPAMAQTIEAYVGERMDDARMGPVHWQVLALVASGYFFDVLDFTIFGALVPDLIKSGFVTQAQVPWIGSVTVAGLDPPVDLLDPLRPRLGGDRSSNLCSDQPAIRTPRHASHHLLDLCCPSDRRRGRRFWRRRGAQLYAQSILHGRTAAHRCRPKSGSDIRPGLGRGIDAHPSRPHRCDTTSAPAP
jgi:hypothetical protein